MCQSYEGVRIVMLLRDALVSSKIMWPKATVPSVTAFFAIPALVILGRPSTLPFQKAPAVQIAAPPDAAEAFRLVDQALAAGDLGAAYEAARTLHSKVVRMLDIRLPALGARLATERAFDALQAESWQPMVTP